ncbi:hypothetical protein KY362_07835 [Candidatus Woesearchaeota archaeon]|nr:hypothetical protein [Candidatus Woesearchaeota archaeon]
MEYLSNFGNYRRIMSQNIHKNLAYNGIPDNIDVTLEDPVIRALGVIECDNPLISIVTLVRNYGYALEHRTLWLSAQIGLGSLVTYIQIFPDYSRDPALSVAEAFYLSRGIHKLSRDNETTLYDVMQIAGCKNADPIHIIYQLNGYAPNFSFGIDLVNDHSGSLQPIDIASSKGVQKVRK